MLEEVPVPVVEGVVELALVDPLVPVVLVVPVAPGAPDLFTCCLKRSFLNLNTVPHIVVDAVRLSVEDDDEDEDEDEDEDGEVDDGVVLLCVVPVLGLVSAFVSEGVVCCSSPPHDMARPIDMITRMSIATAASNGEPLKSAIFENIAIDYPPPVPLEPAAPASLAEDWAARLPVCAGGAGAVMYAFIPSVAS
ncbi:MAG: hypothetical protein WC828_08215, partial [Thermoleophilia bacterium]